MTAGPSPFESPYAALVAAQPVQPTAQTKRGLLVMSRMAEAQTLSAPQGAVALAVLQESRYLTERTAAGYRLLARRGVTVVLFARGWPGVTEPQPGLHLVGLADDDPLRAEWDVLVCTPRRRFGFVAVETARPARTDMERSFDWSTSHDAEAVGRAAAVLLQRAPQLAITVPPVGPSALTA